MTLNINDLASEATESFDGPPQKDSTGAHRSFSSEDLAAIIGDVAQILLGPPNPAQSTKTNLRWGTRGSFSVDLNKGTWFDNEPPGEGGGTLALIERETGLHGDERFDWLRRKGFNGSGKSSKPDDRPKKRIRGDRHPTLGKPAITYPYTDELGALRYETARFEPKAFRPRQPDGNGSWFWDLEGVDTVPYRLPELIEAVANGRRIVVVEGEKDADALWTIRIPATCNQGGAGKWKLAYNLYLRSADVVIVADNDEPGRDHMLDVAAKLAGTADRIRLLDLGEAWPGCPLKGDTYDYLQCHAPEQFNALVDAATDYEPSAEEQINTAPAFSEEAIALDFANRHSGDLRYVSKWNAWFVWDSSCWREDEMRKVFSIARGICRELALTVNKPSESKRVASAKTRAAVVSLAVTHSPLFNVLG
jgi:putative DNA primase/helicase